MSTRKSIGNSKRFKIFERDNYTCRYCGRKPPEVTLEVDHFIPVKEGGENDFLNLLTSCRECNAGKKARVSRAPNEKIDIEIIIEDKKEIIIQLKKLEKLNKEIIERTEKMVEDCVSYWEILHDDRVNITLHDQITIKTFLKYFSTTQIMGAMDIAMLNTQGSANRFKYMCAILHNWKKSGIS